MEIILRIQSYIRAIKIYIRAHIKVIILVAFICAIAGAIFSALNTTDSERLKTCTTLNNQMYCSCNSPSHGIFDFTNEDANSTNKQIITDKCKIDIVWQTLEYVAYAAATLSLVFLYGTMVQSRHLAESEFISQFERDYSSHKMLTYIRILTDYRRKHPTFFLKTRKEYFNPENVISDQFDKRMKWSSCVDEARRYVRSYFFNALDLYTLGKISRESFRAIADKASITVLFDVIEPMEMHLNPEYDVMYYQRVMEICSDIYKKRSKAKNHFENNKDVIIKDSAITAYVKNYGIVAGSLMTGIAALILCTSLLMKRK